MHNQSLKESLEKALPKDHSFTIHHLSTTPSPCPPIFAAPPGHVPEETQRTVHFLSVSISHQNKLHQVLGLEVFIYTTSRLTTIFISKADSTGCLHLLTESLPSSSPQSHKLKSAKSPARTIVSCFLADLISTRVHAGERVILSLFARSQNQYLFPASIENERKHVQDDRGLIRWWCKTLEPIISDDDARNVSSNGTVFLRVPGYDAYSTRTFFPPSARHDSSSKDKWRTSDPLNDLAISPNVPERCLIPRFPDDPKARFLDSLDEELADELSQAQTGDNAEINTGKWKSVRSLDEFWETLSYRQECSSGRLVGFIWVLFPQKEVSPENGDAKHNGSSSTILASDPQLTPSPLIISPTHYEKIESILLNDTDYSSTTATAQSTKTWIEAVSTADWGMTVTGQRDDIVTANGDKGAVVNGGSTMPVALDMGLLKKKKKRAQDDGVANVINTKNEQKKQKI